ncbi:hypothetical protein H2203_005753 [Taxawa tesnikishii (nom. ined.)]|nr:hypothetical protein H2203_005753 [Dothideales sp. JES 119]
MPPKKKSRISNTASPAPPSSLAKTPTAPEEQSAARPRPAAQRASDADIVNDPWTDDEEIGLFKGLIKWKPTGIHKHFQILALRAHLLSNGYIHPSAPHTRIPGIWAKLSTLYDLDALDERENAHLYASEEASEDEADELAQDSNRDSTSDLENDEDGSSTSKRALRPSCRRSSCPTRSLGI